MPARLLAALVALLALVLAPAALGAPAPQDLRAFLLRADEPERPTRVFPRTPAFAWQAVRGAERYEFQLSTSRSFAENAVVWEDESVAQPFLTVPLTLPWISGARYSWFARVRAVVRGSETAWSQPYGFNMRAGGAPRSLSTGSNPTPGMVRWTPVEGATSYQVVFLWELGQGKSKQIRTATTAADLREVYTLHNGPDWANVTYWRVRAVRELEGTPRNGLPVVSYGPWSARFRTVEPLLSTGAVSPAATVSRSRPQGPDVWTPPADGSQAGPHELAPGFLWNGLTTPAPEHLGLCPALAASAGITCPLFRVHVFTDADCVNRVHVSDLVGSPAYVPRLSGPLAVPGKVEDLVKATTLWLGDGEEPKTFDAGGSPIAASGAGGEEAERRTGFWDNDWPTGRYYWTAVPVAPLVAADGQTVEWHEVAFAEDLCASGAAGVFGKTSATAATAQSGVPYVSGLAAGGRVAAATTTAPGFYGKVVAAWKPAPGARRYELQWSRRAYPWKAVGSVTTPATAALLDLAAGTWHYRVRGLDPTLPGPAGLTWSDPIQLRVLPRTFTVVRRVPR